MRDSQDKRTWIVIACIGVAAVAAISFRTWHDAQKAARTARVMEAVHRYRGISARLTEGDRTALSELRELFHLRYFVGIAADTAKDAIVGISDLDASEIAAWLDEHEEQLVFDEMRGRFVILEDKADNKH